MQSFTPKSVKTIYEISPDEMKEIIADKVHARSEHIHIEYKMGSPDNCTYDGPGIGPQVLKAVVITVNSACTPLRDVYDR